MIEQDKNKQNKDFFYNIDNYINNNNYTDSCVDNDIANISVNTNRNIFLHKKLISYVYSSSIKEMFNLFIYKNMNFFIYRKFYYKTDFAKKIWLDYYNNICISSSPSYNKYKKLLKNFGVWNMPNPYKEGNENYYKYCEYGIFLKEIDFLLERWGNKNITFTKKSLNKSDLNHAANNNKKNIDKQKLTKQEEYFKKINKEFSDVSNSWCPLYLHRTSVTPGLSINQTERINENEWILEQDKWERECILCLTELFLDDPKMWLWIKDVVHYHNVALLCKIILDNVSEEKHEALTKIWKENNWI